MPRVTRGRNPNPPSAVWLHDSDPKKPLHYHRGENLVWQLLNLIVAEVKEARILWEPRLFPGDTGRGMRPDVLVELPFYRGDLHIEIYDGNSTWGDKRQQMERIERDHGYPVLFINRPMLKRLARPDGGEVLSSWMYRVLFRKWSDYGTLVQPAELFEYIGEKLEKPRSRKLQRRDIRLEHETRPDPRMIIRLADVVPFRTEPRHPRKAYQRWVRQQRAADVQAA